jgi:hypothetical protein
MPKSPYLEQAQLNVLHGTAHPNPSTFYAGMWTTMPGNDQWTLSVNQSTGSLTLTFGGQTTTSIAGSATAAQVQAALQALSSIGANSCTVTGLNGQTDAALPGDTLLITLNGALGWAANGNITHADTTLTATLTHTVTGSAGVEATGGGYARVSIPTFPAATGNGTSNSAIISFGASTASYTVPGCVGWFIADAATGGHVWYTDVFAGTNDVQTVAISGSPTGGTFTLTGSGNTGNEVATTAAIPYNADALQVQSALEAVFGAGNVTVRSSGGGAFPSASMVVTFVGNLRYQAITAMTHTDSFTGGSSPSASVTHTTTGASGTQTVNNANITPQFAASALTIFEGSPQNPAAVVI